MAGESFDVARFDQLERDYRDLQGRHNQLQSQVDNRPTLGQDQSALKESIPNRLTAFFSPDSDVVRSLALADRDVALAERKQKIKGIKRENGMGTGTKVAIGGGVFLSTATAAALGFAGGGVTGAGVQSMQTNDALLGEYGGGFGGGLPFV